MRRGSWRVTYGVITPGRAEMQLPTPHGVTLGRGAVPPAEVLADRVELPRRDAPFREISSEALPLPRAPSLQGLELAHAECDDPCRALRRRRRRDFGASYVTGHGRLGVVSVMECESTRAIVLMASADTGRSAV